MKKTTIYNVYDEDWETILGINQLKEFATNQVLNNSDDFIEENLKDYYDNWKQIFNLVNKIIDEDYTIQTLKEACLILKVRSFQIEEIEVY